MKKLSSIVAILAMAGTMLLSGCTDIGDTIGDTVGEAVSQAIENVDFTYTSGGGNINIFNSNALQGEGELVALSFQPSNFTSINISGAYNVIWQQSQDVYVNVEKHENLIEHLRVYVENDVLYVYSSRSFNVNRTRNMPNLYIHSPDLEAIRFNGAISAVGWDTINSQELTLSVGGAGNIDISMDVERLIVDAPGAAVVNLSGYATEATITMAGASGIMARNLQTESATVTVAGVGNVRIAVSERLHATVLGVGSVDYIGNPDVTRVVAGVGTVRRVD